MQSGGKLPTPPPQEKKAALGNISEFSQDCGAAEGRVALHHSLCPEIHSTTTFTEKNQFLIVGTQNTFLRFICEDLPIPLPSASGEKNMVLIFSGAAPVAP